VSGNIWITGDPNNVPLDRGERSLWVYSDKWVTPVVERKMTFDKYLKDPWGSIADIDRVIVVGLTDIITPSNRVKTGPFLTEPWRGPMRESIDRRLFIGEPWRAWWHWGCVGGKWDDINHSFALEGKWNQAMDGRITDPCSIAEFLRVGKGTIKTHRSAPTFGGIHIDVRAVSNDIRNAYEKEKARAFEEETTWRGVVKRLGAFAQSNCPWRVMPSRMNLFKVLGELIPPRIVATDLPVDTLVSDWHSKTVQLVDCIVKEFTGTQWTR